MLAADGLVLRDWNADDAEQVFEACQDGEIHRWTPIRPPYSMADAQRFVATSAERWDGGLPSFGMFADDRRTLLGSMGFVRRLDAAVVEIGYWVAPWARRRGVATRGMSRICAWAFGDPDTHRIEWTALVGNVGSRRAAEACGFRIEGVLRSRAEQAGARADVWIAGLVRADLAATAQALRTD